MIRPIKASGFAFALLVVTGPRLVAQEASLLDTVRQNEQREAATRNRPRRPPPAGDILRLPENISADYGSKPSTRPQYVRGLRGLQKRANTTVPPKRADSASVTGSVGAPAALRGVIGRSVQTVPPSPVQVPLPAVTLTSEVNPNVARDTPGLPPIVTPVRLLRTEADPYAPIGLRLGNINVLPFIGVSGGYDSNPLQSAGRVKGSAFIQGEGGLSAQSDWSRHSLNADIRGTYTEYPDASNANRPDVSARIGARYDVQRDTALDFETRARVSTETLSDINLPVGVQQRPATYSYGASSGITQQFGRASVNLRGSVDRNTYDNASLGSTVVDQSDRNQTIYALRLRTGYELTPGITPFIDGIIDTRQYDNTLDRNGFRRSSDGLTGRIGSTFDITSTLTGEIAAGVTNRSFNDSRLRTLTSPVLEASLIWSISPLTAMRLRASSAVSDTVTAFSSGIYDRRIQVDVEHALFRNLTLGFAGEYSNQETQGINFTQDTYTAGVRADYKLSKEIVFRSSYTFQRLNSSAPGGGYSSNIVMFGIRLQR